MPPQFMTIVMISQFLRCFKFNAKARLFSKTVYFLKPGQKLDNWHKSTVNMNVTVALSFSKYFLFCKTNAKHGNPKLRGRENLKFRCNWLASEKFLLYQFMVFFLYGNFCHMYQLWESESMPWKSKQLYKIIGDQE